MGGHFFFATHFAKKSAEIANNGRMWFVKPMTHRFSAWFFLFFF
jgi:hypothetical protein